MKFFFIFLLFWKSKSVCLLSSVDMYGRVYVWLCMCICLFSVYLYKFIVYFNHICLNWSHFFFFASFSLQFNTIQCDSFRFVFFVRFHYDGIHADCNGALIRLHWLSDLRFSTKLLKVCVPQWIFTLSYWIWFPKLNLIIDNYMFVCASEWNEWKHWKIFTLNNSFNSFNF